MLTIKQIDYLSDMNILRLTEFINVKNIEELEELSDNLKQFIISDNGIDPKRKEKYITTLSIVESKINGLKQETKQEDEFIDVSKFKLMSSDDLIRILGQTIKKDEENKLITFLCMLSAYTKDSQFNLSFNAPSSSGKSYIPTEIAQLFPRKDVIEVGYCSPTAFFHDKAKEYKKDTNEIIVDLSHKILIFLDQPHTLLLQHLRPLLSHDKAEINLKITDKTYKGGLRTKNIVVLGYPSVIFCTAGLHIDEQELTRFILLSPEINQEKIREAVLEKVKKSSDPYSYSYSLEVNEERQNLISRIKALKSETVSDIIIQKFEIVVKLFFERAKTLKPKHQRDIGRIISLIKVFAYINLWFRERRGSDLIANEDDIKEAFKLWDIISESQEYNLPPYLFNLFKEVILTSYAEKNNVSNSEIKQGITRKEILLKHFQVYGRHLSDQQLRKEILSMLETSGLIIQEEDTDDHRIKRVYPTIATTISQNQKNSGGYGEVKKES